MPADMPTTDLAPVAEAQASPESEDEAHAAPAQPEPASNLLDFDFDLDSFGKGATPPATPAADLPASAGEAADSRLMDFRLDDLDPPKADAPVAPANAPNDDDEFPPLELDVPPKPGTPASLHDEAGAMDFDLSGISLDLDTHGEAGTALQDVPTLGETSYSNTAEMATKLDLASAYQEIGDREGARELLEEVIRGGDSEQSEKAKVLLQKLA
jgi:pilus assembly protein FimV